MASGHIQMDVRQMVADGVSEFYITVVPGEQLPPAQRAQMALKAVADALRQRGAWICQERLFAAAGATEELTAIRREVYGDLDDGVAPTWLVSPGASGLAAIQVHAISGIAKPAIITGDGVAIARQFTNKGHRWLTASGLCAPAAGDASAQARATFLAIEGLLAGAGGDMTHLARTWIFMDDILAWYGQLNQVRNQFFAERGLIGDAALDNRMPASTGIGVSPANGARCAIDIFGVVGPQGSIQRYHAAGKQRSAYEYGSAFARAARVNSPAGTTVFVSGTAAIDPAGATCFKNDARGQITMTIENVIAVLREMGCRPEDVVQTMAYCATPQVRQIFEEGLGRTTKWPWVTVLGDVCRDDLLFEVEATACPGAK